MKFEWFSYRPSRPFLLDPASPNTIKHTKVLMNSQWETVCFQVNQKLIKDSVSKIYGPLPFLSITPVTQEEMKIPVYG